MKILKKILPFVVATLFLFGTVLSVAAYEIYKCPSGVVTGSPNDYQFIEVTCHGDRYLYVTYDGFEIAHNYKGDCSFYGGTMCRTINGNTHTDENNIGVNLLISTIHDSNVDWYCPEHDIHFFHPAPVPILQKTMEPIQMERVLEEVKMILPICLVCLVGYLALRKALAVLQSLLHQA